MAETALKEELMPEGGIAGFIVSDEELAAMDANDAQKQFGDEGIANFSDVAVKMASYGRYGDDKLIHAETGELVVPKALIQNNPELKESIFSHLREMGVEDPERYVVGSDANSLNPDTGLPEFFLKKIFKGVKKAFKSVGKVLKKALPVVLPIALSFTPLGPVYGAALGSGLGTLIQGGDLKDALKAGVIAGAGGALFSGVSSSLSGGTFTEGVTGAFADPMGRLSQLGSGISSAVQGQGLGQVFTPYAAAPTPQASLPDELTTSPTSSLTGGTDTVLPDELTTSPTSSLTGGTDPIVTDPVTEAYKPSSFVESIKQGDITEAFLPSGPTPEQVSLAQNAAYTDAYNNAMTLPGMTTAEASKIGAAAMDKVTAASMSPGFLRTYGPAAALGTGALAAGGFFTAPEEEDISLNMQTGMDLYESDPDRYRLPDETPQYAAGNTTVGTDYPIYGTPVQNINPFLRPPVTYAAEGGEIFPRRVGGIMPDEGVPGKDSVKAMLMPGEFVMTTNAVKGLGNGDLNQGINNMYDMMRGLEARGKAMA